MQNEDDKLGSGLKVELKPCYLQSSAWTRKLNVNHIYKIRNEGVGFVRKILSKFWGAIKSGRNRCDTFKVQKVCHFYTKGACKFAKEYRFEHPKFCQKFKTHGLKKFNNKGCEESCNNYHPKACFESMKSKTFIIIIIQPNVPAHTTFIDI